MGNDRILVVGGGAGIGQAVATAWGDRADVWTRSRGVDAADAASVQRAATALLQAHGAPWALVHTVGDFHEAPLLTTPPAVQAQLRASNLDSAVHVVQAIVPAMVQAGRGRVVLFAAAGVERGRGLLRAPYYFALKAAVVQLARALALEVAGAGVTVNTVSPGLIAHPASHRQSQERLRPRVPRQRLGTVDDVVGLVQWLLSPASDYVTGENFTVDGGLQL